MLVMKINTVLLWVLPTRQLIWPLDGDGNRQICLMVTYTLLVVVANQTLLNSLTLLEEKLVHNNHLLQLVDCNS